MNDKKRGLFLKQLRIEKNITQKDLGELLHYSDKAISKWENGETMPNNPETLLAICDLFEISIEELLYGELKTNDNEEILHENMKNTIITNYNKYKVKIFVVIILVLLSIIMTMVAVYKTHIKGTISSYSLYGAGENFSLNNSSMLITNSLSILNLNQITNINEYEINYIKFYYTDNNQDKVVIFGPNDNYYIEEPSESGKYEIKNIINKPIYLEVNYLNNKKETIKIEISKRYANDKVIK